MTPRWKQFFGPDMAFTAEHTEKKRQCTKKNKYENENYTQTD